MKSTLAALLIAFGLPLSALAAPPFPYSLRTKPYTGWNSAVRGNNTVIGMSGATVALPFNIASSELNPAGFAMLMGSVNAQISGTEIQDRQIQDYDTKMKSDFYGLAVNPPPWGFAVTSYSPTLERASYNAPATGRNVEAEVSVRELQFTASRMFLESKLAIGVGLNLAKGNREIGGGNDNRVSTGWKIGGLYKLPRHFTLGLAITPQNTIGGNPSAANLTDMPGFSQDIIMPTVIGAGMGWTPNRFFQAGLSLLYVGKTKDTALLRDESIGVGQYATLQPRVGGTYTFFQFDHWKGDLALGSYYEVSRIQGEPNRLHGTMSVDVNIYMFNTGFGIDRATGYRNLMIGVGIDIIRTLRAFDIVPKDAVPPYNGFFPRADRVSADGLSEGLSAGEVKSVPTQSLGDVRQIIEDAPGKIADKFSGKTVEPEPKTKKKIPPKKKKAPVKKPAPLPKSTTKPLSEEPDSAFEPSVMPVPAPTN